MVCGQIMGLLMVMGLRALGYSWGQSIPRSPCPNVFQYKVDSSGMWYGLITIPPPEPDFNIKLSAALVINAVLPTVSYSYMKYCGKVNNLYRISFWRVGYKKITDFHTNKFCEYTLLYL